MKQKKCRLKYSIVGMRGLDNHLIRGVFIWDYSGTGIHGRDHIHVLLGPIQFSE